MLHQSGLHVHPEDPDYVFESWEEEYRLSYVIWRLLNPLAVGSLEELSWCSRTIEETIFVRDDDNQLSLNFRAVKALSPNTLQLLRKLTPKLLPALRDKQRIKTFRKLISNTLSARSRNRNRKSVIADLASVAIHTQISPIEFWKLSERLLREKWDRRLYDEASIAHFQEALGVLRSAANPAERLHGPDIFGKYLLDNGLFDVFETWAEIGRRVIGSLHSWPIVVLDEQSETSAFAVPVLIAVEYDDQKRNVCIGHDGLQRFDWGSALSKAREVAEFFWAHQHNRLPDHKERTLGASVILDVSPTTRILGSVQSTLLSGTDEQADELLGRSLEGCLVISILNRFMGNRSSPNYSICGQVGGGIAYGDSDAVDTSDKNRSNWRFEPVDGIEEKLIWAATASDFHTIVVPAAGSLSKKSLQLAGNSLERCRTMLHVVDTVFGVNWRREKYIRCPDIAFARDKIRNPQVLPHRIRTDLERTTAAAKEWLKGQERSIALAPTDISAVEIMAALNELNEVDRLESEYAPYPKRSISFLRVVGEEGSSFASLLCEAGGASPRQTNNLLLASDLETAQSVFAEIVGSIDGGYRNRNERFPDVLVLLATILPSNDAFSRNPLRIENLLTKDCANKIREKTEHRQFDRGVQAWERTAGKARVILVDPDTSPVFFPNFQAPRSGDDIWEVINDVSNCGPVFEHRQLEKLIDGSKANSGKAPETVEKLQQIGLIQSSFAGWTINPRFKPAKAHAQNWESHRISAEALNPILNPNSNSHVHGQTRFTAANVSSSNRHLASAREYLERGILNRVLNKAEAQRALQKIDYDFSLTSVLHEKSWESLDIDYKNRGNFRLEELLFKAREGMEWCIEHRVPEPSRLAGLIGLLVFAGSQVRRQGAVKAMKSELDWLDYGILHVLEHCYKNVGKSTPQDIYFWSRANEVFNTFQVSKAAKNTFSGLGISDYHVLGWILNYRQKQRLLADEAWALRMFEAHNVEDKKGSFVRSSIRRIFARNPKFWRDDLARSSGASIPVNLMKDLEWSRRYWKGRRHVPFGAMKIMIEDHCEDQVSQGAMIQVVSGK